MDIPRTEDGLALVPSALLAEAVDDLAKAEASTVYDVCMGVWHEPRPNDRCAVCMAGAAMAFTAKLEPHQDYLTEHNLSRASTMLLGGLDFARAFHWSGYINAVDMARSRAGLPALKDIWRAIDELARDFPHVDYETDREHFHASLRLAAAALAERGL